MSGLPASHGASTSSDASQPPAMALLSSRSRSPRASSQQTVWTSSSIAASVATSLGSMSGIGDSPESHPVYGGGGAAIQEERHFPPLPLGEEGRGGGGSSALNRRRAAGSCWCRGRRPADPSGRRRLPA